jgi:hypothetical protein
MRAYGLDRRAYHDDDARGVAVNGRPTHLCGRASRDATIKRCVRRTIKRRARVEGRKLCDAEV